MYAPSANEKSRFSGHNTVDPSKDSKKDTEDDNKDKSVDSLVTFEQSDAGFEDDADESASNVSNKGASIAESFVSGVTESTLESSVNG